MLQQHNHNHYSPRKQEMKSLAQHADYFLHFSMPWGPHNWKEFVIKICILSV